MDVLSDLFDELDRDPSNITALETILQIFVTHNEGS